MSTWDYVKVAASVPRFVGVVLWRTVRYLAWKLLRIGSEPGSLVGRDGVD